MFVHDVKTYKVRLKGEEVELRLDFEALIKMHKRYGNAFLLIHAFAFENDIEKLPSIIVCMANKEVTEEDVKKHMVMNVSSIEVLSSITLDLLNAELTDTSEFKTKSEIKKNLVQETGT